MARKTVFTHVDGTVSTRNSKTRVYEWAVEATTDNHAEAEYKAGYLKVKQAEAADFDQAVKEGTFARTVSDWSGGGTYTDFYVKNRETGALFWIGAEIRTAEGEVPSHSTPFERAEAITSWVKNRKALIASIKQEIADLLAGPQYRYSIARWSERRESAERALGSFPWPNTTFRVVQPQEAPAKASKR